MDPLTRLLQRLGELVGDHEPGPTKACPMCGNKGRSGRLLTSDDPDEDKIEPCPVCQNAANFDRLHAALRAALKEARERPVKLTHNLPIPGSIPCPSCTGWPPYYVYCETGLCITCAGKKRIPNPAVVL